MSSKTVPRYESERKIFPTRLRALMAEHGTTQKQLAEYVGCRPQTISLYIGGETAPDIYTLEKIADYFGVQSDYLLGRLDIKAVEPDLQGACAYSGLSEAAMVTLHDSRTSRDGYLLQPWPKDIQVSYIELLSDLLESPDDFYGLMKEVALYLVYGGGLPDDVYQTDTVGDVTVNVTVKEGIKFVQWANAHGREVLSRDDARDLHLQLAGERMKEICKHILDKKISNMGGKEDGEH